MRSSVVRLAQRFGELSTMHGIVTYRLSPYELKILPDFVSHIIPNTARRMGEASIKVLPFFVMCYFTIQECSKMIERSHRKNPADYENDE